MFAATATAIRGEIAHRRKALHVPVSSAIVSDSTFPISRTLNRYWYQGVGLPWRRWPVPAVRSVHRHSASRPDCSSPPTQLGQLAIIHLRLGNLPAAEHYPHAARQDPVAAANSPPARSPRSPPLCRASCSRSSCSRSSPRSSRPSARPDARAARATTESLSPARRGRRVR